MNKIEEVSAGTIVVVGDRVLLGHATGTRLWDLPKGRIEPGERPLDAALRELREETGLNASQRDLIEIGRLAYIDNETKKKDLHLFVWVAPTDIKAADCECTSFINVDGDSIPEMDRFMLVPWRKASMFVGASMRRVLDKQLPDIFLETEDDNV